MIGYGDALLSLNKDYRFITTGYEYSGIQWLDERELPSKDFLDGIIEGLKSQLDKHKYKTDRALEYPSWQILADAIYHQQKGDNSKMAEYIKLCDDVKQKYPKSK
jgi:hypothetical protein